MDPPILNPDVPAAASAEPGCNMPNGQAQSTTIWLKRQFPSDGFGTASVFETFGNHCIALGMPLEMLMVEERSRDGSGATLNGSGFRRPNAPFIGSSGKRSRVGFRREPSF